MVDIAGAEQALRQAAIAMVQNEKGVRVEDYLTVLASATGTGALAAAGFDVVGHTLTPGQALFFEPVNEKLAGAVVDQVVPDSVYAILRSLATRWAPESAFPTPAQVFGFVASSVGRAAWGRVSVTAPPANTPWVLPLRVAFEIAPVVVDVEARHGLQVGQRHVLTAAALRSAIIEVSGAIDPTVAVRLALEVAFGMAKMAPMTAAAFAALSAPSTEDGP